VLMQILVILITLKLQIDSCNGQISKFELSTIIMRHEVRVLLGYHCKFVVGLFIFSFNSYFSHSVSCYHSVCFEVLLQFLWLQLLACDQRE